MLYIRLHIARAMIHLALRIWPEGSSKALLLAHLGVYSAEIMRAEARND